MYGRIPLADREDYFSDEAELPPDATRAIEESLTEHKTGLFDSHPSDSDRIDSARAEVASVTHEP